MEINESNKSNEYNSVNNDSFEYDNINESATNSRNKSRANRKYVNIDMVSSKISPILDYDKNIVKPIINLTPRSEKACLKCVKATIFIVGY